MEYTLNSGAGSASSRQQLRARCHTAPSPVRVWREPPGAAGRALAASRHTAVPKACKSTLPKAHWRRVLECCLACCQCCLTGEPGRGIRTVCGDANLPCVSLKVVSICIHSCSTSIIERLLTASRHGAQKEAVTCCRSCNDSTAQPASYSIVLGRRCLN